MVVLIIMVVIVGYFVLVKKSSLATQVQIKEPTITSVTDTPITQPVNSPETTSMNQLQEFFKKAGQPNITDVKGSWMLTAYIETEKFITGEDGPDHILFDLNGIKGKDKWTLIFNSDVNGKIQATSNVGWIPTGDVSPVNFNSNGDMIFEKDYGGDGAWIFRCRDIDSIHLVCLLQGNENGHAMEFSKI